MQKIVIGLSGGMDSVTLLGLLLQQGYEVHCCSFYYASKHNQYEIQAAKAVVSFYQHLGASVFHYEYNLEEAFKNFKSDLLLTGGSIPEGHYEAESMRNTVVPARNLIFAAIMAGFAESIDAQFIGLGVHLGDHHIYPDCRLEFIKSLDATVFLATGSKVQVLAPLLEETKSTILKIGYSLSQTPPYYLTRTCYKDQVLSCGKCGSCIERLEAFTFLNIKDPIEYEE